MCQRSYVVCPSVLPAYRRGSTRFPPSYIRHQPRADATESSLQTLNSGMVPTSNVRAETSRARHSTHRLARSAPYVAAGVGLSSARRVVVNRAGRALSSPAWRCRFRRIVLYKEKAYTSLFQPCWTPCSRSSRARQPWLPLSPMVATPYAMRSAGWRGGSCRISRFYTARPPHHPRAP